MCHARVWLFSTVLISLGSRSDGLTTKSGVSAARRDNPNRMDTTCVMHLTF